MSSFLSDSYPKPKLIESRLINKMVQEQNKKISFETKAITHVKTFILQHWKMIGFIISIIFLFYWRYKEIQNIRNKKTRKYKNNTKYEDDSDDISSEI